MKLTGPPRIKSTTLVSLTPLGQLATMNNKTANEILNYMTAAIFHQYFKAVSILLIKHTEEAWLCEKILRTNTSLETLSEEKINT